MKVFISWSGEQSRKIAEQLKIFIPRVIQSVEVFYSPEDIEKGQNWGRRLDKELAECNYGVVCLTPHNVSAPWIHFEAGALSKSLESRVSALMVGVTPSDVKGPLARFQNTRCDEGDLYQLIQSINKQTENPLDEQRLKAAFNAFWSNLNAELAAINDQIESQPATETTVEESAVKDPALEEILQLVRSMADKLQETDQPTGIIVGSSAGKDIFRKKLDWLEVDGDTALRTGRYSIWLHDAGPNSSKVMDFLCKRFPSIKRSSVMQGEQCWIGTIDGKDYAENLERFLEKLGARVEIEEMDDLELPF